MHAHSSALWREDCGSLAELLAVVGQIGRPPRGPWRWLRRAELATYAALAIILALVLADGFGLVP